MGKRSGMRGKGRGETGDVQAYDAKYDNQAEMEDIGDSEREAQDDAKDADPLAVDACWRSVRVSYSVNHRRKIVPGQRVKGEVMVKRDLYTSLTALRVMCQPTGDDWDGV